MRSAKYYILVFTLLLYITNCFGKKSYEGHQVLRVKVTNNDQANLIRTLENENLISTWNEIRGSVDIMASPINVKMVKHHLSSMEMDYSLMIEDVQALIDKEAETMESLAIAKERNGEIEPRYNMDWESYHPLEDFYEYFDFLEANFTDVTTEIIGQSYEGRDLRVLKICRGGCGNKPAMFIEGGIHANEWIGPAVVMYFARALTEDLSLEDSDLVERLDWFILPSVNPDGYQFSQDEDRLWRKTRSPTDSPLGCMGADPNRNWDFHWAESGASDLRCHDHYHGLAPFSEVEVLQVSSFLEAHRDTIRFFDDVHSYSQLILLPWGFEDEETPPGEEDRVTLADKANAALFATHNQTYVVGNIVDLLYPASGGSLDWTLGVLGIKYSYSMELRDTGEFGVFLPPEQILPCAEEAWAFHVSAARDVIEEYGEEM